MDKPHGSDLSPDGADDHSAVLNLLNSDAWQRRLTEARAARERILAERALSATPPDLHMATVTRLEPLVLVKAERTLHRFTLQPEAFHEPEFSPDGLQPNIPEDELTFDEDEEAAEVYAFPFSSRDAQLEDDETLWAEDASEELQAAASVPAPLQVAAANAARTGLSFGKIMLGFAVGLGAGIGVTSLVWVLGSQEPQRANAPETALAVSESSPAASVGTSIVAPPVPDAIAPLVALPDPAQPQVGPANLPRPQALVRLPASALPPVIETARSNLVQPVYARVSGWQLRPAVVVSDLDAMTLPVAGRAAAPVPGVASNAPLFDKVATEPEGGLSLPELALAPELVSRAAFPIEPAVDAAPLAAQPSAPPPDAVPRGQAPSLPLATPLATEATMPALAIPHPAARSGIGSAVLQLPDQPPLPQMAAHLVTLLAPPSIRDTALAETDGMLRDAGFSLAQPKRVIATISATHVRYYYPEDRELAEVLAARLGGAARDFSGERSSQARGNIEVWLEGTAPKVAKAKVAKKQKKVAQAPREDPQISVLRERIIRNLESASP